jgi:DNA-directed RNA polymerase subunit M/transcription elongation factor TFIIS
VRCPGCNERLGVRDEDAGRKARCTKCGRVFLIGEGRRTDGSAQVAAPLASPTAPLPEEPAAPTLVTFECSLCQTRMTARVADVGRRVACPDCGRRNVIPPPPKPRKSTPPPALAGEQYDLWGVDERPWESGPGAPPLHAVECRVCQTLMYATDAQIGKELVCPDCGAKTIAVRAKPAKPKGTIPGSAGSEYQLDPASAPEPRPMVVPIAIRDAELHEHARATTVGPDGRLIVQKQEEHKRPVRPAVPLVKGVWRMLLTEEVIARGLLISIMFGAAAWLIVDALLTPGNAGLASFAAIILIVFGMATLLLWFSFAAPMFLAIVGESADGHDRLHEPPGWSPFDWFEDGLYLVTAVALAGMPGMLVWRLGAPLSVEAVIATGAGAALLIFPVALLGALLENSPLAVISPKLLSSLVRRPGQWLMFYAESALIAAGVAAAAWGLNAAGAGGLFALPVLAMGAALLYMRLLGRLAWWLSDVMPAEEDAEYVDPAAAAHPHLAADLAARRAAARAQAEAAAHKK